MVINSSATSTFTSRSLAGVWVETSAWLGWTPHHEHPSSGIRLVHHITSLLLKKRRRHLHPERSPHHQHLQCPWDFWVKVAWYFENSGAVELALRKFLYSHYVPVWWKVLERWSAFLLVGRRNSVSDWFEDRKWRVERERHTGQSELTNIFQTSSSYYSDDGISSKFRVL